jgi:hypothetical protein
MGEVVELHDQLVHLADNQEFIADCCRFAENILTEAAVRKKYRLAESTWEALGSNDELVEKVEAEKLRRIRDGSSKREKAQLLVVKAPDVVASIMMDDNANARHRIDSAKVLNDFAANGPQGVPTADRFQITIVLNSDVERYDKSIEINPNDVDPNHIEDTPQGPFPIIAAKKKDDDQW